MVPSLPSANTPHKLSPFFMIDPYIFKKSHLRIYFFNCFFFRDEEGRETLIGHLPHMPWLRNQKVGMVANATNNVMNRGVCPEQKKCSQHIALLRQCQSGTTRNAVCCFKCKLYWISKISHSCSLVSPVPSAYFLNKYLLNNWYIVLERFLINGTVSLENLDKW